MLYFLTCNFTSKGLFRGYCRIPSKSRSAPIPWLTRITSEMLPPYQKWREGCRSCTRGWADNLCHMEDGTSDHISIYKHVAWGCAASIALSWIFTPFLEYSHGVSQWGHSSCWPYMLTYTYTRRDLPSAPLSLSHGESRALNTWSHIQLGDCIWLLQYQCCLKCFCPTLL